jgi:adenosine deaminase
MLLSDVLGLSDAEVTQLLLNSVDASFADEATKARLRAVVAG